MASEPTDGSSETLDLPPDVSEWLEERASVLDVDHEEFVAELLGAHHAVATDGVSPMEDALDRRFGELRSEFGRDLDDIRRRVVQVKQETEQRAPVDHSHEEFEQLSTFGSRVSDLDERVSELSGTVDAVAEAIESHETDADDGGTEVATVEEHLDDIEEKLTRVASAAVSLREGRAETASASECLADIQRQASLERVETATCGGCGEQVPIALLPEPTCPHCDTLFGALQPEGSATDAPRLTSPQSQEITDE